MYVLMALAYVVGGGLLGAGLYLIRNEAFPSWWPGWLLLPFVRATPRVTHLQGWVGVALGASILAVGFTPVVPEVVGGLLVLGAVIAYLVAVVLFVYSTYLSRRIAR